MKYRFSSPGDRRKNVVCLAHSSIRHQWRVVNLPTFQSFSDNSTGQHRCRRCTESKTVRTCRNRYEGLVDELTSIPSGCSSSVCKCGPTTSLKKALIVTTIAGMSHLDARSDFPLSSRSETMCASSRLHSADEVELQARFVLSIRRFENSVGTIAPLTVEEEKCSRVWARTHRISLLFWQNGVIAVE